MKVFVTEKLTPTLQTFLGMVENNGEPQRRKLPNLPSHLVNNEPSHVDAQDPTKLSEHALVSLFATCVLDSRLPQFQDVHWKQAHAVERLRSNISACCNQYVSVEYIKKNIIALARLDLEQAAAVVISAIYNDKTIINRAEILSGLIAGLHHRLLTESCMWLERHQRIPGATVDEAKFSRLVIFLDRILSRQSNVTYGWELGDLDDVEDWPSLLPLLLRVRRCQPRNRCLFIPSWIFDILGMKPPAGYAVWDRQGRVKPGHEPVLESDIDSGRLFLSRKAFRSLQRRLFRYYRYGNAAVRLRKAISKLESEITYSTSYIRSHVLPSENTVLVAHHFFALQRRLQRKVVSDLNWIGFLGKGESGNILQNNPEIPTTFQQRLDGYSGQTGLPVTGPVLTQIDECCLLMEEYVLIYGNGDRSKLGFTRGVSGGSGRGSVDDYNALCDILKTLCRAAKDQGLEHPEPVRKFLAKDIMWYNQSFDDDAFAGGRVPGWEPWLAQRRQSGILGRFRNLEIGD